MSMTKYAFTKLMIDSLDPTDLCIAEYGGGDDQYLFDGAEVIEMVNEGREEAGKPLVTLLSQAIDIHLSEMSGNSFEVIALSPEGRMVNVKFDYE